MMALAAACGLAFAAVGLVVAIRLIALARRTHGLPEILVAVALLCGGLGVGFLRVTALYAPLSEGLASVAALGVHLCRGITVGAIVIMVWRVFVPGRVWSSALVGLLLLGLVVAVAGEVREMRPPATTNHPIYWLWTALMAVSFSWASWESLRYHAMLRRRIRLGLADPVVANRILLWGVASGCIAIQTPVILASIVLSGGDHIASWALVVVSVFSCLASATVWLAFFPPALLLAALLEAGDALQVLILGTGQASRVAWILVGGVLATLLILSAVDEVRRAGARAELALREAEQRFRRLAERFDDIIGDVGPDGRLTYVSPNQREVLGYEPEELLGRHVVEIAAMLGASPFGALSPAAPVTELKAAGPYPKTWRVRRKDGAGRWFETEAHTYRSSEGELCLISVSRDVTERIEAEKERRELEAQMQQARRLESLGVLAGGIAHDFNNLLVGILSNAEIAVEDLEPGSSVRLRAEEIKRASERASELTQQLLAYAGKADVSLETIDLGALVRELAQLLRASLPKTAKLRVELGEETPWIHADATQVRQVVMNLLTNAGDALEGRPGVVTVLTGMTRVDQADLARHRFAEGLEAGECAYVEVGDTGRGIDAEQLHHIFDPFYTTKFQGRGLGLAAVAGIVRGHRGAVCVESEPSEGTRVRVFLPRAAEAVESVGEVSGPGEWRGHGTVLVVDDDQMVRTAAVLLVERLGFRVLSASSGAEAVELLRKNVREVSCALLDVTMPVMDGEETFWRLREIRPDLPVLFMSGHSSRDIDSRLLGKSRVDRLRKPFHRAGLERRLRGVLEGDSPDSTATPGPGPR